MRQWMIQLIGPERWDQLLAVLAVAFMVLVPLIMLIVGTGLWHKMPWTEPLEEVDEADRNRASAIEGSEPPE